MPRARTATPGSDQVQPVASDMVSVAASTRFTAQVTLARKYTAMANAMARQFGVKLDASAAAYDDQEAMSAGMLGSAGLGGAAAVVPAGRAVPAGHVVPADLVSGGMGASLPAGEVPSSPRDMARLIETGRGGAGKKTWQAVESTLRLEAKQLSDAADQLGAAISTTGDGWQAQSADAAIDTDAGAADLVSGARPLCAGPGRAGQRSCAELFQSPGRRAAVSPGA